MRYIEGALEADAHATLTAAGELEGWQRWRADQIRDELLVKAQALVEKPLGGRKQQEALRQLREQWKTSDQGGVPNHGLWKKFDEACNQAYKVVEAWLEKTREQQEASRAQRRALMDELRAWSQGHQANADWKLHIRSLQSFEQRWRDGGHLSEKAYAEMQAQWKALMEEAGAPLHGARQESLARRRALIDEAQALGAQAQLRIDAVRALQQRWQQEAQSVPIDRRHEQKLWDAFRKPIDEAFARKSAEREKAVQALGEHDRRVIAAAQELEQANASGDAQKFRLLPRPWRRRCVDRRSRRLPQRRRRQTLQCRSKRQSSPLLPMLLSRPIRPRPMNPGLKAPTTLMQRRNSQRRPSQRPSP